MASERGERNAAWLEAVADRQVERIRRLVAGIEAAVQARREGYLREGHAGTRAETVIQARTHAVGRRRQGEAE